METSVVLLTCFIALVGLKMCDVEKGTCEEIADKPGLCPWCRSPTKNVVWHNAINRLCVRLGAYALSNIYRTLVVSWNVADVAAEFPYALS